MDKLFGITVEALLKLEILEGSKILSGEGGLNRRITKVNVMEVPDILDWVGAGEFLLTTAYSIKDNIIKLNELIPKFNDKGLAGIGIKTKRYVQEIPDEIINIAQKLNFPIIEIPQGVSYSEIIMEASTEIISSQANILLKIDQLHNRLTDVMLGGGGLKEIAEAIYQSINNTLAIKENIMKTHVILCKEDIRTEMESILLNENNERENIEILGFEKSSYFRGKDAIRGREVNRIRIPIYIRGTNYGDLLIWEDEKLLSEVELTVIRASISIIALDLVKQLCIFEIENKHKIEFFDDLLSSEEVKRKKAVERAVLFHFDKNLSYVVMIVSLKHKIKEMELTPNNVDFLHQLNSKLVSILERLVKYKDGKIIYGNKSDRLIILFGSEKNKENKKAKKEGMEFCNQILSYAKKESIIEYISIGIGRKYDDVYELYKSYREANKASETIKGNDQGTPIHYDDLGIYRILSYEELKPELLDFYKETLEPLVLYDKEKGSELVKTLEMYFIYEGNFKKVSEAMYAHYNTIIYRIQRIKDIMGVDFEEYNNRLNIQIGLKIARMMQEDCSCR